ncbi:YdhH/YoaO family protein, partial [Bacillus paralicheniformis]
FPGGGSKEQSVSFLEELEEAEFAGRKITVQLDWREGKQASHTAFTLDKSSW